MSFYLYPELEQKFEPEKLLQLEQTIEELRIFSKKEVSNINSKAFFLNKTIGTSVQISIELRVQVIQLNFPIQESEFNELIKLGFEKIFFQDLFNKIIEIINPFTWQGTVSNIEYVKNYRELMMIPPKSEYELVN